MVCVRISESEVIARKIYVDVLCPPFNEIRAFFCILMNRRFLSIEEMRNFFVYFFRREVSHINGGIVYEEFPVFIGTTPQQRNGIELGQVDFFRPHF